MWLQRDWGGARHYGPGRPRLSWPSATGRSGDWRRQRPDPVQVGPRRRARRRRRRGQGRRGARPGRDRRPVRRRRPRLDHRRPSRRARPRRAGDRRRGPLRPARHLRLGPPRDGGRPVTNRQPTSACCPPGRTPPRRSTGSPTPPTSVSVRVDVQSQVWANVQRRRGLPVVWPSAVGDWRVQDHPT